MKNWAFLFFLLTFIFCHEAFGTIHSSQQSASSTPSITEFLDHEGILQIPVNYTGGINISGFQVVLDECRGVVAQPLSIDQNASLNKKAQLAASWSPLQNGLSGNICFAVAVLGGDIYVGGNFSSAGSTTANNIAKWDGNTWSSLSVGLGGTCYALAVLGSDLYAGGSFSSAGGIFTNNIAKWNGTFWEPLGVNGLRGLNSACLALAVSGSNLYAGGNFSQAGLNIPTNYIAKWDGSNWSALGTGLDATCLALATSASGDVYAGGGFLSAGGVFASRIAKWDGSNWSAMGAGLGNICRALFVSGTDVYAGGNFTTAGSVSANFIAKWDGSNWSALGTGLGGNCYAITGAGGYIYAGGVFGGAGGVSASSIARWDGSSWSSLGGSGVGGQVLGIAISGIEVYVGGQFSTAGGGFSANHIAKYSDALLPVSLFDFKGLAESEAALLIWQTVSENNNKGFEVQRSANGVNWHSIGFVSGVGVSTETQNYRFTDSQPKFGTNFYRLKQLDFDGRFEYSDVVTVKIENNEERIGELFPNPSSSGMVGLHFFSEKDKNLIVTVLDGNGKTLIRQFHQLKKGQNKLDLRFSSLVSGVYFVQLGNAPQSVYRTLIIE